MLPEEFCKICWVPVPINMPVKCSSYRAGQKVCYVMVCCALLVCFCDLATILHHNIYFKSFSCLILYHFDIYIWIVYSSKQSQFQMTGFGNNKVESLIGYYFNIILKVEGVGCDYLFSRKLGHGTRLGHICTLVPAVSFFIFLKNYGRQEGTYLLFLFSFNLGHLPSFSFIYSFGSYC